MRRMKALSLLYANGLTREGVSSVVGKSTHALRLYERGERFPPKEPYVAIVRLAESRGITLLARDFIVDNKKNDLSGG